MLEPWKLFTAPVFHGLERVPGRGPLLFVGNHTLVGILDAPFLALGLYEHKGILLRGLGDHAHFKVPGWRGLLRQFGVVDGTRENCARLMEAGESILVFPGGAREVSKRKGEKYKLVWRERRGFARMAIRHRCTIVPFSAIGVEDALDIVMDADELLQTPVGRVLANLGLREDLVMPVIKGIGPTPIPRPERLYFRFGHPIDPSLYGDDWQDDEAVSALRSEVARDIEAGIEWLKEQRHFDPDRHLVTRVVGEVGRRLRKKP
ncbi:MAG: acyltransferase family protein [Deltaproteobacteria bacterium]|nr:acyltransferase family protein [Deltaproteobacteria bacterium]MBW2256837.1 acyltransferase family protein [Deltaproteobacteria bacterium]